MHNYRKNSYCAKKHGNNREDWTAHADHQSYIPTQKGKMWRWDIIQEKCFFTAKTLFLSLFWIMWNHLCSQIHGYISKRSSLDILLLRLHELVVLCQLSRQMPFASVAGLCNDANPVLADSQVSVQCPLLFWIRIEQHAIMVSDKITISYSDQSVCPK